MITSRAMVDHDLNVYQYTLIDHQGRPFDEHNNENLWCLTTYRWVSRLDMKKSETYVSAIWNTATERFDTSNPITWKKDLECWSDTLPSHTIGL